MPSDITELGRYSVSLEVSILRVSNRLRSYTKDDTGHSTDGPKLPFRPPYNLSFRICNILVEAKINILEEILMLVSGLLTSAGDSV